MTFPEPTLDEGFSVISPASRSSLTSGSLVGESSISNLKTNYLLISAISTAKLKIS